MLASLRSPRRYLRIFTDLSTTLGICFERCILSACIYCRSPDFVFWRAIFCDSQDVAAVAYYGNHRLSAVGIEGVTTTYHYGANEYGPQLSSVVDALDQEIGYGFDVWGRMTTRAFYGDDANPQASEHYQYDDWGRVEEFTDCNGAATKFEYDLLGKLAKKTYMNGQTEAGNVEYAYNSAGQLASITSECTWGCSEQVHCSYDKLGRLQYRSGVGYGSIAFQRDAMGRTKTLSWMKESDKQTSLSYSYDMAQRVVGVYQDNGVLPLASYSFVHRASSHMPRHGAFGALHAALRHAEYGGSGLSG